MYFWRLQSLLRSDWRSQVGLPTSTTSTTLPPCIQYRLRAFGIGEFSMPSYDGCMLRLLIARRFVLLLQLEVVIVLLSLLLVLEVVDSLLILKLLVVFGLEATVGNNLAVPTVSCLVLGVKLARAMPEPDSMALT